MTLSLCGKLNQPTEGMVSPGRVNNNKLIRKKRIPGAKGYFLIKNMGKYTC